MSTFEQNLSQIRGGVYGRDVREAIAEGLEQASSSEPAASSVILTSGNFFESIFTDTTPALSVFDGVMNGKNISIYLSIYFKSAIASPSEFCLAKVKTEYIPAVVRVISPIYKDSEPKNPETGSIWLDAGDKCLYVHGGSGLATGIPNRYAAYLNYVVK